MDGDFQLNKLGWYTPKIVQPNDFLNAKLENDTYGIWYTVQFQGDAQTHLWQAKTAPVSGERVYGHIEKTASGKSTKFKRAKKEDIPHDAQGSQQASTSGVPAKYAQTNPDTQDSIARSVALKAAVNAATATHSAGLAITENGIIKTAEVFLAWLKGTTKPTDTMNDSEANSLYASIAKGESVEYPEDM